VDPFNHGWDAVRYATEDAAADSAALDDDSGGVLKLKLW